MNQQELEKHIKFDMFITILIYVLIFICFIISVIAILSTPVKAQEQVSNITSDIRSNYDCPFGYNSYGFCAIQTDNGGGVRSTNVRYNGVLNTIGFGFPYYFNNNGHSTQTIDIYSTTNDFRNNGNINVYCYSYQSSPTQSYSRSCSFRFISQKHIQVIYPYDTYQWHEVIISSNQAITGVSNYLISKVTLTYDDGTQDYTGIIDNATSNTTDIINNNNSNTSEIIENQNINNKELLSQLSDLCTNVADMTQFVDGVLNNSGGDIIAKSGTISNVSNTNGGLTYSNNSVWTGVTYSKYIDISDSNVYLYFDDNIGNNTYVKIRGYDSSFNFVSGASMDYLGHDFKLCTSSNVAVCNSLGVKYIRFSIESPNYTSFTLANLRVNTTNGSFCPYGSRYSKLDGMASTIAGSVTNTATILGSKIDDVEALQQTANQLQQQANSLQQAQNDYLMDNSDPTISNSEINNVLGLVSVNDPLSYLLTLPLNLLNKINIALNGNCSDFSIGSFGDIGNADFSSYEFKFPCLDIGHYIGSNLWTTIDVIMAIGLLVVTIMKFYHAITNILTLGAEDKAESMFKYWTPMEFLCVCLGGNYYDKAYSHHFGGDN